MPGKKDAIKLPREKHRMASFITTEVLLYFMQHYLDSTREQNAFFRCCCGNFLSVVFCFFFLPRGNFLFSVVKSVLTWICFLPLYASLGILTSKNCHSSSESSLVPSVWQFDIVYHVRISHPLEKVFSKK